jgi:prophage regulatory protein
MKLLSAKKVAKIIDRSPVTLYRWWKVYKIFPMPIFYNNRAIAWDEAVVNEWLESNKNNH